MEEVKKKTMEKDKTGKKENVNNDPSNNMRSTLR